MGQEQRSGKEAFGWFQPSSCLATNRTATAFLKPPVSGSSARTRALHLARLAVAALCLFFTISGCAASSSYMGIALTPGEQDPALQALAQRARGGDKQAQLKLGSYYQYAADGIAVVEGEASAGRAQAEDVEYVRKIFEIGTRSRKIKKYGSWRLLALARAAELYEEAASETSRTKTLIGPSSSAGRGVTTSRISTGPIQTGFPEAGKRLAVILDAIFREQFVTRFNDPYGEACQGDYTYADWQREAHFIVEGRISYRYLEQSAYAETERSVRREGSRYKAEIEITRFIKWPDRFPKIRKLSFNDRFTYGQLLDEHTGDYHGCETWAPPSDSNQVSAIAILQYLNAPIGNGKFEIIETIEIDRTI